MPCGCRDPYFHTWEGAREGIGGGGDEAEAAPANTQLLPTFFIFPKGFATL